MCIRDSSTQAPIGSRAPRNWCEGSDVNDRRYQRRFRLVGRNETMPQMTRRDFVKLGAVSAGALGTTPLGFDISEAVQVQQNLRIAGAKEVHSLCPYCAVGLSLIHIS